MIPVDQTRYGTPYGNCFSACVASILEMSIEQVPQLTGPWSTFAQWLAERGLTWTRQVHPPLGYSIMCGDSPRGPHAVVALDGQAVHDPHWSRQGLLNVREYVQVWRA